MNQRRSFLKTSATGAVATGALAAPMIAKAQSPEVRWRLASSFPKALDTIYGAAEVLAKRVAAVTNNRFRFAFLPAVKLFRRSVLRMQWVTVRLKSVIPLRTTMWVKTPLLV